MTNEHPFQVLFETLGRIPTASADVVNRRAFKVLSEILTVPVERAGRCILLRAPRAGHGKTHLLSRIQHKLGGSHEFVPLQSAFGCRIDAVSVTDDTLRRLVRPLPASGGLTVLDLLTRRLFSAALQPLVMSGEVPCQDREGAITGLRMRPIETFDFHHPNAVTARWASENFEVLGQRLSIELAQRCNLPVSGIAFWVNALFHFASSPLESSSRVRVLAEEVHNGSGVEMERLESLLALVSLLMRVVLIADDLEGFSTDETAALRLAAFLGTLRHSVERIDVILSLNQDIWENAFMPRLSGGLVDRLSEVIVDLDPLTEVEMEALLDSRVPGIGRRILERIEFNGSGIHARGLIQAAGLAWVKATAMDSVAPSVVAAVAQQVEIPPVSSFILSEPVLKVEAENPIEVDPVTDVPVSNFSSKETLVETNENSEDEVVDVTKSIQPTESFGDIDETLYVEPVTQLSTFTDEQPFAVGTSDDSPTHELPTDAPAFAEPHKPILTEASDAPQADSSSPTNIKEPAAEVVVVIDEQKIPVLSPIALDHATESSTIETYSLPDVNPQPSDAEESEPAVTADADRVDDLLRQFRERYGRGSL